MTASLRASSLLFKTIVTFIRSTVSAAALAAAIAFQLSTSLATAATISSDGCNSTSFSQVTSSTSPGGNIFLGRRLQTTSSDQCSGSNWSLAVFEMDWEKNSLKTKSLLFKPPGMIRGHQITSAYDPSYFSFGGEDWVAFECWGSGMASVGTCMGPFNLKTGLDLNRATLVIAAAKLADGTVLSASVPKLLNFKGRAYLYWTVVRIATSGQWINLTTRGVEIQKDPRGSMNF